jgi:DNA gyrase subunit A
VLPGIEVDDASDEVIGMVCVNKQDKSRTILVVSEKGFGKKTNIDEYRITNRGGKGVKTISVTDKTGYLVGILDVTEKEDLMITCKSGITIRTGISSIREAGRATQGVKLIRLDDSDAIAAITKLDEFEEESIVDETVIVLDAATNSIVPEQDATTNDEGDATPDQEDTSSEKTDLE